MTRWSGRLSLAEIKATHQRTGIPFLYITQNVDEAVEIGDQVFEVTP